MIEKKILEVLVLELKLNPNINTESLKYNETPGWDSLAHMRIIAALEEAFDCIMETEDILDLSSFSKAVEIMRKY